MIEKYHLIIQSIAINNGVENYKLDQFKIKIYRYRPYASWQKGSIESAHRKIRKFLPKGKTLKMLPIELTKYPLEILNFHFIWILATLKIQHIFKALT